MSLLEPIARPVTTFGRLRSDLNATTMVNGLIGFIFAATGPMAIILAVGDQGGLDRVTLASWVFGSFFMNGILSIISCWLYRTPLAFFWTMPGAVLVGPALGHLSFEQVVGAYFACGLLMLVLGLSGWVRRAMLAIPMPIVMGMVAGVFLRFGTNWIVAVRDEILLAGSMTLVFIVLSAMPALGRRMPPLIGALLTGAMVIAATGSFDTSSAVSDNRWYGGPTWFMPEFSWQAMFELVVPLAITVLVVQNGQGAAVLHATGHKTPINYVTSACGLWSVFAAAVGSVPTCLTGPTNALISSSGKRESHYAAGIIVGILAMAFGILAPGATSILLACPPAFIATIAGLAMIKILGAAFSTAFGGRFLNGGLITFLVTVSGISIFSIGAPFWGLVFGFILSFFLDPADHKLAADERARQSAQAAHSARPARQQ
ncbi:MAG: benzoate/H(+) symporter BenE family transporter [Burkholderiaceae bacterium]